MLRYPTSHLPVQCVLRAPHTPCLSFFLTLIHFRPYVLKCQREQCCKRGAGLSPLPLSLHRLPVGRHSAKDVLTDNQLAVRPTGVLQEKMSSESQVQGGRHGAWRTPRLTSHRSAAGCSAKGEGTHPRHHVRKRSPRQQLKCPPSSFGAQHGERSGTPRERSGRGAAHRTLKLPLNPKP